MNDLSEFHALGKGNKRSETILGYIIPIKNSNKVKLRIKKSNSQIFHYEWFKKEIKNLAEVLNSVDLEFSEYECIPRFRYLSSENTLYIPDNYIFSDMTLTFIVSELGLLDNTPKIEKTIAEHLKESKIKIHKQITFV